MDKTLKARVVPFLRSHGFKGSFPHFRRLNTCKVDLLTFQFDRNGGGFLIEIAQCPHLGITTAWGKHVEPSKVSAWDLHPDQRQRIKPSAGSGTDSWFRYDKADIEDCANQVLALLPGALTWFQVQGSNNDA